MTNDVSNNLNDVISHYDLLVDENNDPVRDPLPLREYMDKWDGPEFIEKMNLSKDKSVLEIGVGTGRLALRAARFCGELYGVDVSPKSIARAEENLKEYDNVKLICADFLSCEFDQTFDVIYCSLTFMHIEEKQRAMNKIASLLKTDGRFILSIDKNTSDCIDLGSRRVRVYPDYPKLTEEYIINAKMSILFWYETDHATVFVAAKEGTT